MGPSNFYTNFNSLIIGLWTLERWQDKQVSWCSFLYFLLIYLPLEGYIPWTKILENVIFNDVIMEDFPNFGLILQPCWLELILSRFQQSSLMGTGWHSYSCWIVTEYQAIVLKVGESLHDQKFWHFHLIPTFSLAAAP